MKTISLSAHDQCGLFTRARASSRDNGKCLLDLWRMEVPTAAAGATSTLHTLDCCNRVLNSFMTFFSFLFNWFCSSNSSHSLLAVIIRRQFMRDECSTRFMGQFSRTSVNTSSHARNDFTSLELHGNSLALLSVDHLLWP